MPRYIDADEIKRILGNAYHDTSISSLFEGNEVQKFIAEGINYAINLVHDEAKTADVVPVIHAHWVVRSKRRKYEESDGTVVYTDCGCSACKRWGYTNMPFCPWCQAVMDQPMEVT